METKQDFWRCFSTGQPPRLFLNGLAAKALDATRMTRIALDIRSACAVDYLEIRIILLYREAFTMNPAFERRKIEPTKIPPVIAAKWSDVIIDEGFTPFPKRLVRTLSKVFPAEAKWEELQVILALVDSLRPGLTRGPSMDFLAFTAGLEKDRFKSVLQALEQRGWIKLEGPEEALNLNLDSLKGFLSLIEKKSEEP